LIEPASSTKLSRIRPVVPQLSQLGSMHVYAVDEALALSENDGKDQQPKLVDESQIEQGSARAAAAVHRHVFVFDLVAEMNPDLQLDSVCDAGRLR
jgi:hypothetical protein